MFETSRFTMIDDTFDCAVCGRKIPPLGYTARDHCPSCLCSVHLDVNPGDRMSDCKGTLEPVGIEISKKGTQIVYKCKKCGIKKKNIAANDDNTDLIIKLSANPM